MVYTQFRDAYRLETTFNVASLDDASDIGYSLGGLHELSQHPSPTTDVEFRGAGVNQRDVPTGEIWKRYFTLRGMYGFRMQNGIPIYLAMGGHSDSESGGVYTHTIKTEEDGTQLPSITIHHERTGTSTAWYTTYTGVKCEGLTLYSNLRTLPVLVAKMDWVAAKATKTAFTLTNAVELPPTANEASYKSLTRVFDPAGVNLSMDGLEEIEINISNGLFPVYAHTWDGSNYTGRWPREIIESQIQDKTIRLSYHPSVIETDLWDELVASTNSKDMVFTWTRSATDYIKVTAKECQVVSHQLSTPLVGDSLVEEVQVIPRKVEFEIKDQINGYPYYGDSS